MTIYYLKKEFVNIWLLIEVYVCLEVVQQHLRPFSMRKVGYLLFSLLMLRL